jgi:outer membrane surface antigen
VLGSWLWPSGYRGTLSARLWRAIVPTPLLALALAVGGCSFSYQLDSLTGKGEPEHANSLRPTRSLTSMPPEQDLAVARAAVTEFLGRGGTDSSMPWENPRTGARGTITTIASAYNQDGVTCRDFLASYVRDGNEAWMQGEACRITQGKWEVRNLKPWNRT